MYHKKNNKKRLSAIIAAAIAAVTLATVGSTLAFLVDKTGEVKNTFTPSHVTCAVEESFNGTTKSNVKIANTGNTDAFIRAAIVVTWKYEENGKTYIHASAPVLGTDYTLTFAEDVQDSVSWFKSGDYYYYNNAVADGASTPTLITSCAPVSGRAPDGYTLSVEILADAIQADGVAENGKTPVEQAWDVTVAADGTISK